MLVDLEQFHWDPEHIWEPMKLFIVASEASDRFKVF